MWEEQLVDSPIIHVTMVKTKLQIKAIEKIKVTIAILLSGLDKLL